MGDFLYGFHNASRLPPIMATNNAVAKQLLKRVKDVVTSHVAVETAKQRTWNSDNEHVLSARLG